MQILLPIAAVAFGMTIFGLVFFVCGAASRRILERCRMSLVILTDIMKKRRRYPIATVNSLIVTDQVRSRERG